MESEQDDLITDNINALHEQVHNLYGSWYERSGLRQEERGVVITITLATELAGLLYHAVDKRNREESLQIFAGRVRAIWEMMEKRPIIGGENDSNTV